MRPFRQQNPKNSEERLALVAKVSVLCVCLGDMYLFQASLHRHWSGLLSYEKREAIMMLLMYPIPCLHLYRGCQKGIFNWFLVLVTYCLLSSATLLIFR